ncbi:hypothetical protein [Nocardioides montaniterrae]
MLDTVVLAAVTIILIATYVDDEGASVGTRVFHVALFLVVLWGTVGVWTGRLELTADALVADALGRRRRVIPLSDIRSVRRTLLGVAVDDGSPRDWVTPAWIGSSRRQGEEIVAAVEAARARVSG